MPYAPGDTLYGREVWAEYPITMDPEPYRRDCIWFKVDGRSPPIKGPRWLSPAIMPRWASRLTLTVGDVAVVRAQEITSDAAVTMGVGNSEFWTPKELDARPFEEKWWDDLEFWTRYPKLVLERIWNTDHPGAWNRNDWCVSATVEVRKGNCDE